MDTKRAIGCWAHCLISFLITIDKSRSRIEGEGFIVSVPVSRLDSWCCSNFEIGFLFLSKRILDSVQSQSFDLVRNVGGGISVELVIGYMDFTITKSRGKL